MNTNSFAFCRDSLRAIVPHRFFHRFTTFVDSIFCAKRASKSENDDFSQLASFPPEYESLKCEQTRKTEAEFIVLGS